MGITIKVFKVIALLSLLQTSSALRKFNGLRVKYGLDLAEAFYEIPTSTRSELIKNYVKVEPEEDFKYPLDFFCYPDDPRVCFMYDRKGNVAGCQISMLKEDVKNVRPVHYNYSAISNYVVTNFFNKPAYSQRTYFTNPENLTALGRQNPAETADGLWTYLDDKLVQIPRQQRGQQRVGDFSRQGCFQGTGEHYCYKLESSISCKTYFPFFSLFSDGDLVGYGMANIGFGSHGPDRGWYEHLPHELLGLIIPKHPYCMDQLALMYKTTTVHIFLVEEPWNMACLDEL